MQNKLFRKGLIFGIIVLLVGMGISQISSSNGYFIINSNIYNIESNIGLRNIMLTGYWNPTGQMIAEFSTDPYLNPDGWTGENWEGWGYNIYSFFPTPYIYNGTFEVDYQKTWEDFWDITADINPIAIISFGAGNGPWEIEYNARNLDSWVPDNEPPYQPTPCPPDDSVYPGYVRHSTLPVQAIADAVNEQTNVNAWIDWNGNPGAYLCEYIAYLGMWYQDIHNVSGDPYRCLKAGFIHVRSSLALLDAKEATKVTIREVIKSLKEFVADADGPYHGWVDGPVEFNGSAIGGVPPYSWLWDFGDGNTSDLQNPKYAYANPGNYSVTLYVTDSTDGPNSTVNDTTWAFISELPILSPPEIYGPLTGKIGVEYDYYFLIPNVTYCDALRLRVDWGDTGPGKWGGPYEPGENVTLSYTWRKKGDYTIRAQVMDIFGTISDWAELPITMPRNRFSSNFLFLWLLERFPILQKILLLQR